VLLVPLSPGAVPQWCYTGISRVSAALTRGSTGRNIPGVGGIAVLGPLAVDDDVGGLGPRDRVVLASLALRRGDVVSAELLADALWGERPPPSWTKVVQGCVVRLRKKLGPHSIQTLPPGYRLTIPADEIDAHRFERLVERARELLTLGEADRAFHVIGQALALWRGRALVDLEGWHVGQVEARRLEELRLDAQELRLDTALRAGRYREVMAEAQARVAQEPLRERRWALLALAQYQAGRQGDALRTLHEARTLLVSELGVDPGPDLAALEQAILRQEPSLVAGSVLPEPSATCPYLGLVPYDVGDADLFFGRDVALAACLHRLATINTLALVGPSGCGKSSLLRAGVVAALRRDDRQVVVVTPGPHPMDALTILPTSGPAPVLVVDQCEEVISLCENAQERADFFAAIADHAVRAPLVVALRADRLGDVSAYPGFARLVEQSLYLLGAMDEDDLRAAVEGPARQAGLLLEPGLVDLLVREVQGEPGALPLLSHALRETWTRRDGRTLTVDGYRQTGGIRGAVAQSAEDVYEQVSSNQRPLLRDLLLRLVAPTPEGEPVRSRVPRRAVATDAEHERLIELLVTARLLTSDDGVVELAHEALARAWPRLRAWLDDDVEGQRIFRHLAGAADAWESLGRPDSELYRGVRLTQAIEWRDRTHADLTPTEVEFLDAAQRLSETERRSAEDRARHGARLKRRTRIMLAGVVVLIVAVVAAGLIAMRQAERADIATTAADARRAAGLSLDADDFDLSLLLAVEAVNLYDSPFTRANLLDVLSRSPGLLGAFRHDEPIEAIDVNPVDGTVAIGGAAAGVSFLAANTLDPADTYDDPPRQLEYRADGRQIAIATTITPTGSSSELDAAPVRLVDAAALEEEPVQLGGFPSRQVEVSDLHYSADGDMLAVSLDDNGAGQDASSAMVWDVDMPSRPVQHIRTGQAWAVALSPDGDLLYVGALDPTELTTYDVATGRIVRTVGLSPDGALDSTSVAGLHDGLEVSPDGATLAVRAPYDDTVLVLDAATLTTREMLRGHTAPVTTVQFSRDGTLIATGSDDQQVLVWDVATGAQQDQLQGHSGPVWGLAFGPDDATLYSASTDRMLLAWDVGGDGRLIRRTGPVDDALRYGMSAVPAPDGEAVAYIGPAGPPNAPGGTIRFLDVAAGRLGAPIATSDESSGATWRAPDFEQFATAGEDGWLRVWDRHDGEMLAELSVAADVADVAYTADGENILVSERSGTLFQIDADTLEPSGAPVRLHHPISEVVASPDGRTALVLHEGEWITAADLAGGSVLYTRDLGFGAKQADISPDGRLVAVVCESGEVGVLDIESGNWLRPPVLNGDNVTEVAYAPDGATFVSTGLGGTVSIWDGRTNARLGTVRRSQTTWAAVEFLPDGHTVVIATPDGDIHTWDTRPGTWMEFACTLAGRNLTTDEWSDAFGDRPYRETCPAT
jgi:WD40 repeat protein/DNA-binding SARP family transcriptional activator